MSQHETETHLPDGGGAGQRGSDGTRQWLLFAGSEPKATNDVPVATFRDESQARRAFLNERLRGAEPGAWAQLVATDGAGRTRVECWFGQLSILGDAPIAEAISSRSRALAGRPKPRGWRRPVGTAAMVVVVTTAAASLIGHDDTGSGRHTAVPGASPSPEAPAGILVGYEATRTTHETYAPGESLYWDPTDAVHQVTVLVGTLSVEDGAGYRTDYQAGASYAAGWVPYTASNRTAHPITVTARFLRPLSAALSVPVAATGAPAD